MTRWLGSRGLCLATAIALALLGGCGVPKTQAPEPEVARTSLPSGHTPVPVATLEATGTFAPLPSPYLSPSPTPTATASLAERLRLEQMPPRDDMLLTSLRLPAESAPLPSEPTPIALYEGLSRTFWVADLDVLRYRQISATLRLLTNHLQMWVEDGVVVDQTSLERSARAFEESIHPTAQRLLGARCAPGTGGNPPLVVLNARFEGAVGYYTAANEAPRALNTYSNEQNMLMMNLAALQAGTAAYEGVLAHEYQHLLHACVDPNEDAWLNEGASELLQVLSGYDDSDPTIAAYSQAPDVQLTAWADGGHSVLADYGASYLFLRYALERLGEPLLSAVLQYPANGAASFDAVLAAQRHVLRFEDLFADWVLANALDDPAVAEGQYAYAQHAVQVWPVGRIDTYPATISDTVRQYGADYWELLPAELGALRLTFVGAPEVKLIPNEPTSGRYQWWSNRGDWSHSFLEHAFDLRQVTSARLEYNVWYALEQGYDYAYVRVSSDGGQTWEWLRSANMTLDNPSGNALGPGYTGRSGADAQSVPRWLREELDLTPYAGKEILLRFECVTDDAIHEHGLCLDDIRIPAIGFYDDVEEGERGWRAQGFLRHDNSLPQDYVVQVIRFVPTIRIERLAVQEGRATYVIEGFGEDIERVWLAISAVAPVTTEPALYTLHMEQFP